MEVAFVEGTLPEEDRRVTDEASVVDGEVEPAVDPTEAPAVIAAAAPDEASVEEEEPAVEEAPILTPMERTAAALPDVEATEAIVGEDVVAANEVSNALAFYLMLSNGGVGTSIERQSHGWKLKFVDGGTVIFGEGETPAKAIGLS